VFDGFELQCGVMKDYFLVEHLSLERLLKEWRWLCPQAVALIARNAFGDLYLRDEFGKILKLDVAIGQIKEVAESEAEFRRLATTKEKREEWFAESDELAASRQGLKLDASQCIGFKTALVFAESGAPNSAYVADLYEYVSFLGELHRQISQLPEGSKVRLEFT
jgi:hypothetical protein